MQKKEKRVERGECDWAKKHSTPQGTRKTIYRNPCDEDCKRRLNLDKVSVKVCVKTDCEHLKVQAGDRLLHTPPALTCLKYIEEARGKHKPTRYSRERRIYRRGAVGGWHYRDM
jgi:hypothetical protein